MKKLYFALAISCLLVVGASIAQSAQKKILYFTAGSVPTTTEKAEILQLREQATAPYVVGVRNSLKARLRGTHRETADYVAGAAIPPNYRDGGVDVGSTLYPVFDPDDPPTSPVLPSGQATFSNGDTVAIPGGGSVTLTISNNAATVSAYTAPDAGS